MSDWKPINTAPRDGTEILLFGRRGVVSGWWADGESYQTDSGMEYDGPVWVCLDDTYEAEIEDFGDGDISCEFTHWMPVPDPPKETI